MPASTLFCYLRRIAGTSLLLLSLAWVAPATSQNFVVHYSIQGDDGNPKLDGDGDTNKAVVWNGGTVHVVVSKYNVDPGYTLTISAGAIVKFADEFTADTNGVLHSWKPPSDAGIVAQDAYGDRPSGVLIINGALLTDIRDDSIGGDTNGDGSATSPTVPYRSSLCLRFSGDRRCELSGSTLRYFAAIGHLGSMRIANNKFVSLLQITPADGYPQGMEPGLPDSRPTIVNNMFDLRDNGFIDLCGSAPLIEGNTFMCATKSTVVYVGLRHKYITDPSSPIYPNGGTAQISDNIFHCGGGINVNAEGNDSLYTKARFACEISNNVFECPAGNGSTALELAFEANATISQNDVKNFLTPLTFRIGNSTIGAAQACGLDIHNNKFAYLPGGSGPYNADTFWHRNIIVKAPNNYWGDPSGPLDPSNADGYSNPNGTGIHVTDGIDYRPFVGGTKKNDDDAVQITASAAVTPIVPKSTASLSIIVTRLYFMSAQTGKLHVTVRDDQGNIINGSGTAVAIAKEQTSAAIPAVTITVPEFAKAITVEAAIVPDGDGTTVYSNTVQFEVKQPPDAFSFLGFFSPGTNTELLPDLSPGGHIQGDAVFRYTHTTSNVNFDVTLQLRDRTGAVLATITHKTFSFPPSKDTVARQGFDVRIPIFDVMQYPGQKVYGIFIATDDNGNRIGGTEGGAGLVDAARMNISIAIAMDPDHPDLSTSGPRFFVEGQRLGVGVSAKYRVYSDIGSWQINSTATAYDGAGTILQEWPATGAAETGSGKTGETKTFTHPLFAASSSPHVPVGARKIRLRMLIQSSTGATIAADSIDIAARPAPSTSLTAVAPQGAGMVKFTGLPVALDVSYAQTPTEIHAEQFEGQFSAASLSRGATIASTPYHWDYRALNKYWAVYDTGSQYNVRGTVIFTYNPSTDFPAGGFNEDSLTLFGLNVNSRSLEPVATTVDRTAHTLKATYDHTYDVFVGAAKMTVVDDVPSPAILRSAALTMDAIYPVPAENGITIPYSLRDGARVRCAVYDALGREVALIADARQHAGAHAFVWNASSLPAGAYVIRVLAGEESAERIWVKR